MSDDTFTTAVRIAAPPADVFPYLTDSTLIVRWMGDWADLQPKPGGLFSLNIKGIPIRGEYLVVDPPHRVVFTWGAAGNDALAPGSTTVEIRLRADGGDTVLELAHRDLPPDELLKHDMGWGHFLARVVVDDLLAAPGVSSGRMFSAEGLHYGGKYFAMFCRGDLVVKLPAPRGDELERAATGRRFEPGRARVMRAAPVSSASSRPRHR